MLQTENRLTKKRDFDLLFKYGLWHRGTNLGIKYLELAKKRNYFPKKTTVEEYEKQLRVAVSVGLKYSKKAAERNRAKRRLMEIAREFLKENILNTGYFILIMPEKKINEQNYAELRQELKLLLNKTGIAK